MNKLALASALALSLGMGAASAATTTYNITGGNWDSNTTWNNNADGSVGTAVYDNGTAAPCVSLGFTPNCAFPWTDDSSATQAVGAFSGTYSGTLTVDDGTNEVVGGSLVVTGRIGDQVIVGGNGWWLRVWEDVTINLATGASTVGSTECYRSVFAPANCFPGVSASQPTAFNIGGGFETDGNCILPPTAGANCVAPYDNLARFAADFDANTGILRLFKEGRSEGANAGGSDLSYNLTMVTSVVPVPAAVWLFASAMGLMGFLRRRGIA